MGYDFHWAGLLDHRELLLQGIYGTVALFLSCLVASCAIGTMVACLRCATPAAISWIFAAYVEVFRNIPPIVQLFFWAFAIGLTTQDAAFIGLSIFTSVYISEVLRSGILSIPRMQLEAARSTGLMEHYVWSHIILPQTLIKTIPALSVEFITLMKNTSIAMTIAYVELTFVTQEIESRTFRGVEAATAVTVMYISLCLLIVLTMYGIERMARSGLRSL